MLGSPLERSGLGRREPLGWMLVRGRVTSGGRLKASPEAVERDKKRNEELRAGAPWVIERVRTVRQRPLEIR